MAYYSQCELQKLGMKYVGKNVSISKDCKIYDAHLISIGDHSRIDDFSILSGMVTIGKNCHITPMCLLAGGREGIVLNDFVTLAYGVKVFSQSDDYSGVTLTNSTIPRQFKNEFFAQVILMRHAIIGTNSIIFPGVTIQEGTAIGAGSVVTKSTEEWAIYVGSPAKKIKARDRNLLSLERQFLGCEDDA